MANDPGALPPALVDLYKQSLASAGASSTAQQPIVPMWTQRSQVSNSSQVNYSRKKDGEGDTYAPEALTPQTQDTTSGLMTNDQATAAWLDMPDDQKAKFVEMANQAGLGIKTAADAASAWSKAVGLAESYNKNQKDSSKYLSPFEAMNKLGGFDGASKSGSSFNGFSAQVSQSVRHYTESEIGAQAQNVFAQELGRAPTPAEIKAMTLAVYAQADANPTVTSQSTQQGGSGAAGMFGASGSPFSPDQSSTVTSGSFDPSMSLLDMARQNPDHAAFQAASTYYTAAMQALSAIA